MRSKGDNEMRERGRKESGNGISKRKIRFSYRDDRKKVKFEEQKSMLSMEREDGRDKIWQWGATGL